MALYKLHYYYYYNTQQQTIAMTHVVMTTNISKKYDMSPMGQDFCKFWRVGSGRKFYKFIFVCWKIYLLT